MLSFELDACDYHALFKSIDDRDTLSVVVGLPCM